MAMTARGPGLAWARLAGAKAGRALKPAAELEHALQERVAGSLQVALAGVAWWSGIDHGAGKMGKAAAGRRKVRGVKAGIPDIVVLFCGRLIGIELKRAGGGAQSPEQRALEVEWRAQGAGYCVARSLAEVEAALRAEGVPIRYRVRPNGVDWEFCGWGEGERGVSGAALLPSADSHEQTEGAQRMTAEPPSMTALPVVSGRRRSKQAPAVR